MFNLAKSRQIRLEEQDIRCCDDFDILPGKECLLFAWELWFDVDKYFGTDTREKDAWINLYTQWWYGSGYIMGEIFEHDDTSCRDDLWVFTDTEQDFLRRKMEAYVKGYGFASLPECYEKLAVQLAS